MAGKRIYEGTLKERLAQSQAKSKLKWRKENPIEYKALYTAKNAQLGPDYWRARRYGITQEQYEGLLARQEGRCAICRGDDRLVVDHCHETKIVRGLLCSACNTGLGRFKDNSALLERTIDYLSATEN